jgi:hypothetical protein
MRFDKAVLDGLGRGGFAEFGKVEPQDLGGRSAEGSQLALLGVLPLASRRSIRIHGDQAF